MGLREIGNGVHFLFIDHKKRKETITQTLVCLLFSMVFLSLRNGRFIKARNFIMVSLEAAKKGRQKFFSKA